MSALIQGQCHCGQIRWQACLPKIIAVNCHCNMCRELGGADYSPWVVVDGKQFVLLAGESLLSEYAATTSFIKRFCSNCGSVISCINNDKFPGHIYVARGNIKTDVNIEVDFQVFTENKAPWVTLDKHLPIYNPK